MSLNLKTIFKTLWWIIVLCFVAFFLHSNLHRVDTVIQRLPYANIALSILSLTIGKLFLVSIMQQSLQRYKVNFTYSSAFSIYNITQLGKYIPGSIWQFVGRIGMYNSAGINNKIIRDTILLETFWVLFSAFVLGVFLIGITQYQLFLSLIQKIPESALPVIFIFAPALLLTPLFTPWRTKILAYSRKLTFTSRSIFTALLIWLALGFAFWITLIPLTTTEPDLAYIIGLYALSYAIGFVVPFAPAGIGVRETILVLGLTPFLDINTSIILATLNRIFYILVEICLAAVAVFIHRHSSMDAKLP